MGKRALASGPLGGNGAPGGRGTWPVWVTAAVSLLGSVAVGLLIEIHLPRVNDEFSYLLAADTFVHGRLSNPPHPMGVHFETFHVIQRPTYASKYPPAQGLVLAAGQVLAGHPVAGVWVSAAALCAAVSWLLLAWFPPRWAFVGGLLVALRFGIVGYWSQDYWGGAVAGIGGALVVGALPRLQRAVRVRDALWLALGLSVLANSRPYEGLATVFPVALAGIGRLVRSRGRIGGPEGRRAAAALLLVLGLNGVWMGAYNARVSGSPLRFPYVEHTETYSFVPLFVFQNLRPIPEYHHEMIRKSYMTVHLPLYRAASTFRGWLDTSAARLESLGSALLGIAWGLPLLALALRRGRSQPGVGLWAAVCGSTVFASLLATYGGFGHYVASALGALTALVVASLRVVDGFRWRGRPVGRVLVVAVLLATAVETGTGVRRHRVPESDWSRIRHRIEEQLRSQPGQDLVLVHYDPSYNPQDEWVHNGADLDGAPVLWARAMDPRRDQEILDYYRDRRAWLLHVTTRSWRIVPYPRLGHAG